MWSRNRLMLPSINILWVFCFSFLCAFFKFLFSALFSSFNWLPSTLLHAIPNPTLFWTFEFPLSIFTIIRCCIALFETHFDRNRQRDLLALTEDPAEYTASDEDPEPFNELDSNLVISKVKFEDLKKRLPKLDRSVEGEILWEVRSYSLFLFGLGELLIVSLTWMGIGEATLSRIGED